MMHDNGLADLACRPNSDFKKRKFSGGVRSKTIPPAASSPSDISCGEDLENSKPGLVPEASLWA